MYLCKFEIIKYYRLSINLLFINNLFIIILIILYLILTPRAHVILFYAFVMDLLLINENFVEINYNRLKKNELIVIKQFYLTEV